MSTAESSVALLETVIKNLSSSGDLKGREFEKEKLQAELRKADEKLGELVDASQEHLKKTIQSFGSVVARVKTCRSHIGSLREKLSHCRTLLYCNRDDLKKHWQEGLEYSEILILLDKIDKAVSVPDQLQRFIARKHYLHAAQLLVSTVDSLEGTLSNVDALRDLRSSLQARRSVLHEPIIDELHKQICSESVKVSRKGLGSESHGLTANAVRRTHSKGKSKSIKGDNPLQGTVVGYSENELTEDLQGDPEDDLPVFMHFLVESLLVLDKVFEAVEALKGRIKRDMMMVIRRAADHVAKRAVEKGEAVTTEELATKENPQLLLHLLDVAFESFRTIGRNHALVLAAFNGIKDKMSPAKRDELQLYTMEDVWSKVEFAIRDMVHPYLDQDNVSAPQQSLSSFTASESAVALYFATKKRTNIQKSKRDQLFKFECSSSAEAMHSYMREQDMASALPEDTYADYIVWNSQQLICKPDVNNITVIFTPVMEFIDEIARNTSSSLGLEGVLYHFITDFVTKVYLDQLSFMVTEKATSVAKGLDALRNLCEPGTLKSFKVRQPLLKSTVTIYHIVEELFGLMKCLPLYSGDFLFIIMNLLEQYLESCYSAYKSLVLREEDGKPSRVISANWVRDEDINRLLKSMPSWINLLENSGVSSPDSRGGDDDVDSLRAGQEKEASLLIGNLEKSVIEKGQVILDTADLKSLSNLQESLEWLAAKLFTFTTSLTGQATGIVLSTGDKASSLLTQQINPVSDDSVKSLVELAGKFKNLAETCLLVLHLEIRCHCFYFLGRATRESSYVCDVDGIEADPQIPLLAKDIRDIDDACRSALSHAKSRYLFDGLGYLIASILVSSAAYIKKFNRNGIKKMCQNIFTIQQELANIVLPRGANLERARQYFEMLYLQPDDILKQILEQGAQFKEQEYATAFELLFRGEVQQDRALLEVRKQKLRQIIREAKETTK